MQGVLIYDIQSTFCFLDYEGIVNLEAQPPSAFITNFGGKDFSFSSASVFYLLEYRYPTPHFPHLPSQGKPFPQKIFYKIKLLSPCRFSFQSWYGRWHANSFRC